jgi:hypothetical protein
MAYVKSAATGKILETYTPDNWTHDGQWTTVPAKQAKAELRTKAFNTLHAILKPGDTVMCVLRSTSRSGMMRHISFFAGPDMADITTYIARLLDGKIDRDTGFQDGMKVAGCGMDMGFHIVYNLGHAMWPNGTPEPHGTRNGDLDVFGGYALKSRWL